ncbi:uncharacterized protein LOC125521244 [Triticum urartu]|uniref:uncharacterized protein LOC125521244 n=1 Tax=Triticum urartu TaxID=4572 RepID=UPI00204403C8|nr:uncharacterized protein LOC125521244 [Triticum urartu]
MATKAPEPPTVLDSDWIEASMSAAPSFRSSPLRRLVHVKACQIAKPPPLLRPCNRRRPPWQPEARSFAATATSMDPDRRLGVPRRQALTYSEPFPRSSDLPASSVAAIRPATPARAVPICRQLHPASASSARSPPWRTEPLRRSGARHQACRRQVPRRRQPFPPSAALYLTPPLLFLLFRDEDSSARLLVRVDRHTAPGLLSLERQQTQSPPPSRATAHG